MAKTAKVGRRKSIGKSVRDILETGLGMNKPSHRKSSRSTVSAKASPRRKAAVRSTRIAKKRAA